MGIGKGREYTLEVGGPEKKEARKKIYFFFLLHSTLFIGWSVRIFFSFFFRKEKWAQLSLFPNPIGNWRYNTYVVPCVCAGVSRFNRFITSEYVSKGLRLKPYKSKGPMSTLKYGIEIMALIVIYCITLYIML